MSHIDKPRRNEDEYFLQRELELLRQQRTAAEIAAAEALRRSHIGKCPKDGYDLVTRELHGVQIDVCPHCGGVFLDAGELDQLRARPEPGLLDRFVHDVQNALRIKRQPSDPVNPLS